jgi:MFS family permease
LLRPAKSNVRWLLIFWIFILSAVAFLDRVNISIAGSSIAASYHLSNVQLGSVFSALLWGYALFQTLGGRLADRIGPRRVLAAGVIWWGAFTALTASIPEGAGNALILFVATRFLLGAGEAVMYPASNQFIARWIPSQERGIANGWIFAGVGAGAGLSPPLITYLMLNYGWRASFWVCSALGLIAGAVWYLLARDTPADHPRVSATELAFIQSGLSADAEPERLALEPNPDLVPWSRVFASRDVIAVTLSYFSFGYVAWIFFSWFYIYLAQVRGLNLKASAVYAMLPFLAMAGRERAAGQRGSGRRRRRALPGTKFVLVGDCGHSRPLLGIGFRLHEYWSPGGRRGHRFAYAVDCRSLRMDDVVSGRGRVVFAWSRSVVAGRSAAQSFGSIRPSSGMHERDAHAHILIDYSIRISPDPVSTSTGTPPPPTLPRISLRPMEPCTLCG